MRIAIYHNLPSGGGKRALFEMTKRLTQRHEVDVYTLSCAEHDFCDLRPYCRKHLVFPFHSSPLVRRPFGRLNQGIRTVDLLRLRAQQQALAARIDAQQYDLVFAHVCQFGQSPALIRFLQTTAVYYCHEPPRLVTEPTEVRPYSQLNAAQHVGNLFDPLPSIYRNVLLHLDNSNVASASLVLANSLYSRETLYRVYGLFSRVSRLGLDTDHFRPKHLARERRALSVGALTPKKGFDFLIKSLALIDKKLRLPLTIVSNYADPREQAYIEDLARRFGVVVDIRVRIPEQELVDLYNSSLVTVYAPIMEPFGFVPLESMACGTAVIGVAEGGLRETIRHGETGLLVDRDPAQFASALIALLEKRDYLEMLGAQGRQDVEANWSWDRSIYELENHFQYVTGGNT